MNKRNVLWEKHRMYLPEMRKKVSSPCRKCRFFVQIQGKRELRNACIVNIKAYKIQGRDIPPVIPVMEVIKRVGLEGLEECLEKIKDPDERGCPQFEPGIKC